MEKYSAKLSFIDYMVTKAMYCVNENYEPNDSGFLDVDFEVFATIDSSDGENNFVVLRALVGDENNKLCPFIIEVDITGKFEFEGSDKAKEEFLKSNAVAVLFPYLRSVVSDLSTKSNVFPQFKLPLINIAEYLKDLDRVNIIL